MDYNAIIDAQIEKGRTVEITPDGTIRIHAPQQPPQEQPQPPQAPQPEPEAAPATVEGPPPAPDGDNEGNEDPVPDADEAAPHRDGDAPPAEDDDVSLPPTEVEAPAPGEEEDAPPAPEPEPEPAPAPAPGQVADAAPPTEDPNQEAGNKKCTRKQTCTIEGANALLAKGLKVELNSAKIDVLREALRLWRCSNPRVTIKCNSAKIDVVEAALGLGIDRNNITLKTADLAVAEEAEAKGLLPENRIRIRTATGSVSLAEFRRRRTSKRAKLDADGAETLQERQPLGEIQDVGL